ncbi:tripartite motif-containing protein 3-like [Ptychodera flava]|uniref:tripartite motif-containing protein 3-like n=1 Tax=Ptychodera flava TaxID=63121 RepID=UPI00396A2242
MAAALQNVSEAEQLLRELHKDILSCAICQKFFTKPKVLHCNHSFCELCLTTLVSTKDKLINCPTCSTSYQLPDGGVTEMKANFFLDSLAKFYSREWFTDKSQAVLCNGCEENEATHWCMECSLYFCTFCTKPHKKLMKAHDVITLQEYREATPSSSLLRHHVYCNLHPDNVVKFFCETCNAVVCTECTVLKHYSGQHLLRDLEATAAQYKSQMKDLLNQAKQKERAIQKYASEAKIARETMISSCKDVEQRVRKKTADVIQKVKTEEEQLIEQLKTGCEKIGKQIEMQIDDLEQKHKSISRHFGYIEILIDLGTPAQVLSIREETICHMNKLVSMKMNVHKVSQSVEFHPVEEKGDMGILGYLKFNSARPHDQTPSSIDLSNGDVQPATDKMDTKTPISPSCTDVNNTIGKEDTPHLCEKQDMRKTAKSENDGLKRNVSPANKSSQKMFPRNQDYLKNRGRSPSRERKKSALPQTQDRLKGQRVLHARQSESKDKTVIVPEMKKIVVTTCQNPKANIIKKEPVKAFGVKGHKPALMPLPSAVTNKDLMKPARRCQSLTNLHVFKEESELKPVRGKVHKQAPLVIVKGSVKSIGNEGPAEGQFRSPNGITITKHGDFVTADSANNRVQITDKNGNFKSSFTFTEFPEVFFPIDVTISTKDEYVMTDGKNKQVVVSDENGSLIKCFGEEVKNPGSVAISPVDGSVYISDWEWSVEDTDERGHCIKKYTHDFQYVKSFGNLITKLGHSKGPNYLTVDNNGNVFVSDFNNCCIQVYNPDGHLMYSFGSFDISDGKLNGPRGIAFDKEGSLYVSDEGNSSVQKFDKSGKFICRIDQPEDDLKQPQGLAVTEDMDIVVADWGNDCLKVFTQ